MNLFDKIVFALSKEMPTPTNYGWFHITFIVLVIVASFLLVRYCKDASDKTFRKIILFGWLTMAILEIYKQIVFTYDFGDDGSVSSDYRWYSFPYQFCSTPLYVLPFLALLKEGKVRDACASFIMTFSFFGGFVVYLYPNDVFIKTIGIDIQTMVHHGLQVVLGIYVAHYYRKKLNFKFYLSSIFVFAVMVLVAIALNEIMFYALDGAETFNMFFISRHFDCTLPVLSLLYPVMPYPLFLIMYLLGFALAAFVVYLLHCLVIKKILK